MSDGDIKTYVKDLDGNEYPLMATLSNENEVNGNQSLECTIYATGPNLKFISDIQEMWHLVDHDGVEHKIIYAKRKGVGQYRPEFKQGEGSSSSFFFRPTQTVSGSSITKEVADSTKMVVEIKAEPLFFNEFSKSRVYDKFDRHMTAQEAFSQIFKGTNFDFVLADQFDASSWEGFGDDNKLELFKKALEKYEAEFRIAGNVIYLEAQIGRDTQFQYRHRLNSTNIEQEIDAEEIATVARGFGDYGSEGDEDTEDDSEEDWQKAELKEEYRSPLADVLGELHAEPVKDGRVTSKSTMQRKLKKLVDESVKVSVSADVYDLTEQGYPVADSEIGDRVFLIDERINFDEEVRVVSQTKKRNWKGEVIDLSVTFGDENLTKRHQSQLSSAARSINDLIEGRLKLPYSVLPTAEQNALRALNKARTELIFGNAKNGVQGIIAQEKDDPNRMVWLNSAGWMISTDGGVTSKVAATADGIVADVITAGVLNADQVAIMGSDGNSYSYITGAYMELRGTFKRTWHGETNTYDIKTKLENGYVRFRNDTYENSLYYSWNGISTFVDGSGGGASDENYASGTVNFWDRTYSENSGLTISSHAGKPVLMSDLNHVVIHPKSEDSSKLFYFTKSQDGHEGYMMFSRLDGGTTSESKRGGLRFLNDKDGHVQVVDSESETGSETEIEAGTGRFNTVGRRTDTQNYLHLVAYSDNYMKIGKDSEGRRIASRAIYKRTYSGDANVRISSSNTLGRTTSSEKYKVNLENQFDDFNSQLEHSKNILSLDVKKWNDKWEVETLCDEIEHGERLSDEDYRLQKHVGLTSEKVKEAGFSEHVDIGEDGELEGIAYGRLWIHLLPIVKDQQARIEELEAQING